MWNILSFVSLTLLFFCCVGCPSNDTCPIDKIFSDCLALTLADVSYPSNETWWYDSQGISVRVLRHPIAVAYASSTKQVKSLIKCALKNNVRTVPRSGGHSVEAVSSQDDKLVIDISRLNTIKINSRRRVANVGAGIRLGKLYYEIAKHRLAFPSGNCPTVGLGGHVAVGGYGDLTRIWGLAADNILSMKFVDWQGKVIIANATSHDDLFFALRAGGGGSYGIVTKMKLNLYPFPKVSSAFSLTWQKFPSTFDFITTWFKWKPWIKMPAEMKLLALLGENRIIGFYIGDDGDIGVARILNDSGLMAIGHQPLLFNYTSADLLLARAWLFNLYKHYGDNRDLEIVNAGPHVLEPLNLPAYPSHVHASWKPLQNDTRVNATQLLGFWARGPIEGVKSATIARDYYKYTSQMITKEFNEILAEEIDEFLSKGGISLWEPHGGILNTEPPIPNAFAHRKALFNVQHYVPYDMLHDGSNMDGIRRQNEICHKLTEALEPYTNHTSYQGYMDLYWTTNPKIYMPRYYGLHVEKLVEVKKKYDPHNYFSHLQSTPLEL